MLLPLSPVRAQTTDILELIDQVFVSSAELLECNSPVIEIDYENCDSSLNWFDYVNGYSSISDSFLITVVTDSGHTCQYDKYMADYTDGDLLWQSYLVACGIVWREAPTATWQIFGNSLGADFAAWAAGHYEYADSIIYGMPTKIKITKMNRKTYIRFGPVPILSELRLEKKVRGRWVTKYDIINVVDLEGTRQRVRGHGTYRFTVIQFDGKVLYRKKFKV